MKKMHILQAFKRSFLLNIGFIIVIFIAVSTFAFFGFKYNYNNQNLVNELGSQRYKVEQLSKEIFKVYLELHNLEHDPTNEVYKTNLQLSQKKLSNIRKSFSNTLISINKGELTTTERTISFKSSLHTLSNPLNEVNTLWSNILPDIMTFETAKELNADIATSSAKIENSTGSFISSITAINNIIIKNYNKASINNLLLIGILSFVAFIFTIILWRTLYRSILQPMDALFTNISGIGIHGTSTISLNGPSTKSLKPLVEDINEAFDKLDTLIDLIENINKSSSFNEVLEYIYYSFTPFIPFTYIGIGLIEDNGRNIKAAYGISDDTLNGPSPANNLLGYKTNINSTSLLTVLSTGKPRIINDLEEYTAGRILKPYNKIILDAGIRSSITLPIKHNNKAVGIIFFSSKKKNSYTEEHAQFLMTIANSIAIAFDKNIFIKDIILSSIIALAKLAESRDEDTGDHLNRMSAYSETIAELLYKKSYYRELITPEFIDDIEKFSPLHDIGKVGIADKILLKPGKLTDEEFEEMKKHTTYGGIVLRAADNNIEKEGISLFELGREIAENHHEKWDGSGYPNGLKGEEIPLSARIVAVADVFDALTSRRPYKEPFSLDLAFQLISEGSGKHFDPEIVRVFLNNKFVITDLYNKVSKQK
jgi:response regulator RpfG family c-di-GMP phosphodiesterase